MHDRVPIELIKVPVTMIDTDTREETEVEVCGGSRGVSVERRVYRPHFSYAVVVKEPEQEEERYEWEEEEREEEREESEEEERKEPEQAEEMHE